MRDIYEEDIYGDELLRGWESKVDWAIQISTGYEIDIMSEDMDTDRDFLLLVRRYDMT